LFKNYFFDILLKNFLRPFFACPKKGRKKGHSGRTLRIQSHRATALAALLHFDFGW